MLSAMSEAEAQLMAGRGRGPIVVEPCGFGLNGGECYSCELERKRQPFPADSDGESGRGESGQPNPQ